MSKHQLEQVGATAYIVLIYKNEIYCANVGDSRSALGLKRARENGKIPKFEIKYLSADHKPTN